MIELDFKCVPCGGYFCDCPEGIAKYEAKLAKIEAAKKPAKKPAKKAAKKPAKKAAKKN